MLRSCMIARLTLAACAGLIAAAATAQAVDKPGNSPEDFILGAWSDPAKCNRGNATRRTLDEVLTLGDKLNGTCVAIEGFWVKRAMFKYARQGDTPRSNVAPSFRHHRIGVYASEEILENAPRRSVRYTLVGVIGQCETEWPDAVMVLGYCHYSGGPILKVAEAVPFLATNGR